MFKATVAVEALQGFTKRMGISDYCAFSDKFDCLRYAITNDCPPEIRKQIQEIITKVVNSLNTADDKVLVSQSPMNAVTRKSEMWDK